MTYRLGDARSPRPAAVTGIGVFAGATATCLLLRPPTEATTPHG